MATVVIDGEMRIPDWVVDLVSFRQWCHSDEFPTSGRIDYIQGEVWVDTGGERGQRHHAVTEFTVVLGGLVKAARIGRYFAGSLRLSHPGVDLSVVPAGLFASNERLRHGAGKIRESRNGQAGFYGVPNMVLHFIDDADKETEKRLRASYRQAGVDEYWLVEVRGAELRLRIYRHTARGYIALRAAANRWVRSRVFGRSYRLMRQTDAFGNPEYTLEMRDSPAFA